MNQMRLLFTILVLLLICRSVIAQNTAVMSNEAREGFIQKASEFRKNGNYSSAIVTLDSILAINDQDAGILLFKGDLQLQNRQFGHAVATYKKLLPLNFEKTITQINLSYALFMNQKPVKALQFAKAAWQENNTNVNANINYFNALLWNAKTKEAKKFLEKNQILSAEKVQLLKARLAVASGNYKSGIEMFHNLVKDNPSKEVAQEYIEVLIGKSQNSIADTILAHNNSLFSTQEKHEFDNKVKANKMQMMGSEFIFFQDIGKNQRIENNSYWQQSPDKKVSFRINAGTSKISDILNNSTSVSFAQIAAVTKFNMAFTAHSRINFQTINPSNSKGFFGVNASQLLQYQPNDRRMVAAQYSTEILNYTAGLLASNIRIHQSTLITHLMVSGKSGFYAQNSYGMISDNNKMNQFFGSFYHVLKNKPLLKMGVSMMTMQYKKDEGANYFSPKNYSNAETFFNYRSNVTKTSPWYIDVQAGASLQNINNTGWMPAGRLQTELGVQNKKWDAAIKYQTSTVAGVTGTGYSYNLMSVRIQYKW